jgi:hypothetical protein
VNAQKIANTQACFRAFYQARQIRKGWKRCCFFVLAC